MHIRKVKDRLVVSIVVYTEKSWVNTPKCDKMAHNWPMARKAKVYNWEAVKELYIQGVRYRGISDQLGVPIPTLKARIIKERWVDSKMAVLEQRAPKVDQAGEGREAVSKRLKDWFVADAEKVMKAIESHDPAHLELKELEQRESVVRSLHSRLSGQLGWGQEIEQHAVRGNLLAQLAAEITQQREIVLDRKAKSKVIDVQSVVDTEQEACQDGVVSKTHCASTSDCGEAGEKNAFSNGEPAGG